MSGKALPGWLYVSLGWVWRRHCPENLRPRPCTLWSDYSMTDDPFMSAWPVEKAVDLESRIRRDTSEPYNASEPVLLCDSIQEWVTEACTKPRLAANMGCTDGPDLRGDLLYCWLWCIIRNDRLAVLDEAIRRLSSGIWHWPLESARLLASCYIDNIPVSAFEKVPNPEEILNILAREGHYEVVAVLMSQFPRYGSIKDREITESNIDIIDAINDMRWQLRMYPHNETDSAWRASIRSEKELDAIAFTSTTKPSPWINGRLLLRAVARQMIQQTTVEYSIEKALQIMAPFERWCLNDIGTVAPPKTSTIETVSIPWRSLVREALQRCCAVYMDWLIQRVDETYSSLNGLNLNESSFKVAETAVQGQIRQEPYYNAFLFTLVEAVLSQHVDPVKRISAWVSKRAPVFIIRCLSQDVSHFLTPFETQRAVLTLEDDVVWGSAVVFSKDGERRAIERILQKRRACRQGITKEIMENMIWIMTPEPTAQPSTNIDRKRKSSISSTLWKKIQHVKNK